MTPLAFLTVFLPAVAFGVPTKSLPEANVEVAAAAVVSDAQKALEPVSMVETSTADAAWREGERGLHAAANEARSEAYDKCVKDFPAVYRTSQKHKDVGGKGMEACDKECAAKYNTAGLKYDYKRYKSCYACCDSFYGQAAKIKVQKEYHSCKEIVDDLEQAASGYHYLHNIKTGAVYKAFCDMDTKFGGGWTRASDFDYALNRLTDDTYARGLKGWIEDNVEKMETRIEVVTNSGRTYRRFLRNNGIRGVAIDGSLAYSSKCKLNYASAWDDAEDWGPNKNLELNFETNLNKVRYAGTGNWKFNVLNQCHRALRAKDGQMYVSRSNQRYSGGSCGGMTLSPKDIFSRTCSSSNSWEKQGAEGNKASAYEAHIPNIKEIRIWVR